MNQVSSHKPSKRIYAFLIIAFTFVLCAFIFKNGNPFKGTSVEEITPENMVGAETVFVKEAEDTDSDGLFDWEETLRGTDLHKGDSDKDGTSDGDEVKQSRNPLIAGPNDQSIEPTDSSLVDNQTNANIALSGGTLEKTTTAEMAKNMLTQLMYLKNQGDLSPEAKEKMIADLAKFAATSFVYKIYTKDNMLFIDNVTQNDLKVYASNFATIQINLIASIVRDQDAILENISALGRIYENTARQLAEIAIPRTLADIHLNVVNNYSAVSKAVNYFEEETDSTEKTFAIGAYQQARADQNQALGIIANYLRQNGIIFTEDEIGSYWDNF